MRTFFHCVENDLSWLAQAFRVLTGTTSIQTQIERRPARRSREPDGAAREAQSRGGPGHAAGGLL